MKPVIVITVCRRYFELTRTLARIAELVHEFAERPDVVVVWARPEVGRLWLFQKLLRDGTITKLLTRMALPGESAELPKTYPESHNLRLGLEWVRDNYESGATYALVQSADITARPAEGYGFVDRHMNDGAGAVVFHWPNGCIPVDVWHTNFFAVVLDEDYWPPVSDPDSQDVLEAQWGRKLRDVGVGNVVQNHNYNEKRFVHAHLSEAEPEWPIVPQDSARTAPLLISGYQPWWRRLAERLRLVRPFRRPAD